MFKLAMAMRVVFLVRTLKGNTEVRYLRFNVERQVDHFLVFCKTLWATQRNCNNR